MNLTDGDTFPQALIKCEKLRINQKINFTHITKQHIWTNIVHILCGKCDGNFNLSVNLLNRLSNTIELSHEWALKNFKYKELEFNAILFHEYDEGPFKVSIGCKKVGVIRIPVPGDLKLYIFQYRKSDLYVLFILICICFGWRKSCSISFKDAILPSLNKNDRLQLYINVTLNNARKRGKQQCKIPYKRFK